MGFSKDIEDLQRRATQAGAVRTTPPPMTQEAVSLPASPATVGIGDTDDPDVTTPEE